MTTCLDTLTFYFLSAMYSIQYLFLHLINLILHPDRYRLSKTIAVPPRCLSNDDFGTHQYAKLSRYKFHYVEKGDRNNRLLLLIHGYPEFWYSWRFQLRNLSSYYWVVAIDMKGFGDTDKPSARSEYDIPLLVTEMYDFLTAIGRKKCSIVTHGMGGLLGWFFVNKFPDVVENFVSIASAHPYSFLQELSLKRVSNASWYYFCQLPYFPEREEMKQDLVIFDKMFTRMLNSKRGNLTEQDVEAFKYTFSRIEDWVGPMNYVRTLLKRKFLGKNRSLKKTSVPTLFIVGNADPYCSLEMICKSSEYVENFTLKIVEGGGHFLPQEMPNYINSLILDFMKMPEPLLLGMDPVQESGIFKKMIGAGKTVVNYGNQVGNRIIGRNPNLYPMLYF
ncbi:Epoxide hydrolase 4 [Folsomia candida]|uniref:Epoxide hydrolase 4 n=1 Tax=Folsomia candida TaxID=158441 RepID=A0A226ERE1_FOLCA|nr:Epoxide hydrolase 4 [Folsomia candida]